ncbi:hypothetical protein FIU94_10525 [Sulfitobacter sp. THAF37]|uniref:hypothetical protein n=1 Tax=Sulfitobacter sp. THAF37 TaxID=2587855 RepID=UPI001268BD97|nr:hypothetical protein [Sulfitobacter sp. THAF37]QFT59260.1 hypothetical protein FIU94_10525 [Sulfitobacter sp. THAF37]
MVKYLVMSAVVAAMAGPVAAAGKKEVDCGHQAAVVSAVQQARLARVSERKVADHVAGKATWPERYNTAIPLVAPWVYQMKLRDVKAQDLAAAWNEMCMAR